MLYQQQKTSDGSIRSKDVTDAGWSSLVARRAHNPKVVGSNPAPATNSVLYQQLKIRIARNSGLAYNQDVSVKKVSIVVKNKQ